MTWTKKAFHRVGNHIVNQFEIRRIEVLKPTRSCPIGCVPISRAKIVFKDGTAVLVQHEHVKQLMHALLTQE